MQLPLQNLTPRVLAACMSRCEWASGKTSNAMFLSESVGFNTNHCLETHFHSEKQMKRLCCWQHMSRM